jgi:hypothetical protein
MRHALAQEAEHRRLLYGIEVPTNKKYRFATGPGNWRSARYDFVMFPDRDAMETRRTIVELKAGQPGEGSDAECAAIRKDFVKLLEEPVAEGRAFFHLLMATNAKTLPRLLGRYTQALNGARAKVAGETIDGWFELVALVQQDRDQQSAPRLWRYDRDLRVGDLMDRNFAFIAEELVELPLA